MKTNRKESIYIFFIGVLSVIVAGLAILVFSGWIYRENRPVGTSLILGNSNVLNLNGTMSESIAFNFDGSFLKGEEIKQNISIKNNSEKNLYLRGKIAIFDGNNENTDIHLMTGNNWTKMVDGYYYFDGFIESFNTIGFISSFVVSGEKQLSSSSNYIMIITIESLSTDFDRTLVWGL
jgi:hypothetical protein